MLKKTGREMGEWSWVSVMAPTMPDTATTSATSRAMTITRADGDRRGRGRGRVAMARKTSGGE